VTQEGAFLFEDGVQWSYKGFRTLKEGDDFTLHAKRWLRAMARHHSSEHG
jgi:hypothetical protein